MPLYLPCLLLTLLLFVFKIYTNMTDTGTEEDNLLN